MMGLVDDGTRRSLALEILAPRLSKSLQFRTIMISGVVEGCLFAHKLAVQLKGEKDSISLASNFLPGLFLHFFFFFLFLLFLKS